MNIRDLHRWDVSVGEAQSIQARLAPEVSQIDSMKDSPTLVAGVDVSTPDRDGKACAAATVIRLPGLELVEVRRASEMLGFPYIPGLLSFREAPVMLKALRQLKTSPDLILVDGHGVAHPRRFGLACHLGLLVDTPTIGCAKSMLVGRHGALGRQRGAWTPIEDKGELVGAALRTRDDVRPVYVSVGHKVNLESAIQWALASCHIYRIPQPVRLAHHAAARRLPEGGGGFQGEAWPAKHNR